MKHKTIFGSITQSDFIPAKYFSNRHVQTIWPKFVLPSPAVELRLERLICPDGDFIDLAWQTPNVPKAVLFVLHGLEGSMHSHYIKQLFHQFQQSEVAVVLMHFRGCSGQPNLKPRAYHSGEIEDPLMVMQLLRRRYSQLPLIAIGYSLGGNVLLKMLADTRAQIDAAVVISAPIDLAVSSQAINKGFAKLYQAHLLNSMKKNLIAKFKTLDMGNLLEVGVNDIIKLNSFYEFDDKVTAPLHGFANADDYYTQSSSKPLLTYITTKTLIIHALDDPFMDARVIPSAAELSKHIAYELSEKGGHVGFLHQSERKLEGYLPHRIVRFIEEVV